jgi:hypothetical protein
VALSWSRLAAAAWSAAQRGPACGCPWLAGWPQHSIPQHGGTHLPAWNVIGVTMVARALNWLPAGHVPSGSASSSGWSKSTLARGPCSCCWGPGALLRHLRPSASLAGTSAVANTCTGMGSRHAHVAGSGVQLWYMHGLIDGCCPSLLLGAVVVPAVCPGARCPATRAALQAGADQPFIRFIRHHCSRWQ